MCKINLPSWASNRERGERYVNCKFVLYLSTHVNMGLSILINCRHPLKFNSFRFAPLLATLKEGHYCLVTIKNYYAMTWQSFGLNDNGKSDFRLHFSYSLFETLIWKQDFFNHQVKLPNLGGREVCTSSMQRRSLLHYIWNHDFLLNLAVSF